MQRVNAAGMALFALLAGATTALVASFLPFLVGEVWVRLWGVESWPAGTVRSFGRVGPLVGVSEWAVLVVVPLAATVVLLALTVLVGALVLAWRGSVAKAGSDRR